jgi:hypothetical protein
MRSAEVDDDTCIALAVLHGAHMWGTGTMWYVDTADEHPDEVNAAEKLQLARCQRISFTSREQAARTYCEAFGLI